MAGQAFADGHVKRIISTSETALGNKIVYPVGQAKVTAFEFTVPVGAPVPAHTHSFPILLMIQQGEVTLDYGDGKIKKCIGQATLLSRTLALSTLRQILAMFQLKHL